jgi:hypothetical protein
MAKEVKAGVRITGKDDTGSAFSSFSRSLSRAENKLTKFKNQTASLRKGFGHVGRGMAIAGGLITAATVGVAIGIKKALDATAEYASELNDFSLQTGVSTDRLQELDYIAKQTGVGLTKGRAGIVKFSKAFGELKAGTGQALSMLKKVDPQLTKQLKGSKTAGDAYELFLSALAKTEDPVKKSQLAFALFGRSGGEMLRMVAAGPVELKRLQAEFAKMGGLTPKQIEDADAYGDAMDRFRDSVTNVRNTLAVALMPHLTEAATKLSEFVAEHKTEIVGAFSHLIENTGTAIKNLVDYMTENPDAFKKWINNAIQPLNDIVNAIKDVKTFIGDVKGFVGLGPDRRDRALKRAGTTINEGGIPTGAFVGSRVAGAVGDVLNRDMNAFEKYTPLGWAKTAGMAAWAGGSALLQKQEVEVKLIVPRGYDIQSTSKPGENVSVQPVEDFFRVE